MPSGQTDSAPNLHPLAFHPLVVRLWMTFVSVQVFDDVFDSSRDPGARRKVDIPWYRVDARFHRSEANIITEVCTTPVIDIHPVFAVGLSNPQSSITHWSSHRWSPSHDQISSFRTPPFFYCFLMAQLRFLGCTDILAYCCPSSFIFCTSPNPLPVCKSPNKRGIEFPSSKWPFHSRIQNNDVVNKVDAWSFSFPLCPASARRTVPTPPNYLDLGLNVPLDSNSYASWTCRMLCILCHFRGFCLWWIGDLILNDVNAPTSICMQLWISSLAPTTNTNWQFLRDKKFVKHII